MNAEESCFDAFTSQKGIAVALQLIVTFTGFFNENLISCFLLYKVCCVENITGY
jgi:hypothetical protein